MGLFDFFKKKEEEPHYDVTNIKVEDIEENYIFDYDLESWIVKKMYEYDWGNNFYSREFLISNGRESKYLSIEEDDELTISMMTKIPIRKLDATIPEEIQENEKPPRKIFYEGVTYFRDTEDMGYVRHVNTEDWSEVIVWTYHDESEKLVLSIEQSGADEFEATIGNYIKSFEISNILPQKN